MAIPKSIGIKLYDDTFVPILDKKKTENKKLILTTIRDNQEKIIIELYEGTSEKCKNNKYLEKLVLPVNKSEKGEPGIEVYLKLDKDGILHAKAIDTKSGKHTEIEFQHSPISGGKTEIGDSYNTVAFNTNKDFELGRFIRLATFILAVLILLGLLTLGGWFTVTKIQAALKNSKKTKMLTEKKEDSPKVIKTEKKKEEKIIGKQNYDSKKHYVRVGDNLWNICKKYYGDPWYYPALADANPQLTSPRLIYAGSHIDIPPKSELKRWEFIE